MALDISSRIELLRNVPLFEHCLDNELREIAEITDVRSFQSGQELITQGDRLRREFFILVDGRVEVKVGVRKVNELDKGGFFGEIQLLADTPRLATVSAISDGSALVITEASFRDLIERIPTIAVKLVYVLADMVAYYAQRF